MRRTKEALYNKLYDFAVHFNYIFQYLLTRHALCVMGITSPIPGQVRQ